MIREFGALFGATIVGCGSLYAYGHLQDLNRNLAKIQKERDSYKRDYEFQTEQRKQSEALVKELQKNIEKNSHNYDLTLGGIGGILGIGATALYALTQMR